MAPIVAIEPLTALRSTRRCVLIAVVGLGYAITDQRRRTASPASSAASGGGAIP